VAKEVVQKGPVPKLKGMRGCNGEGSKWCTKFSQLGRATTGSRSQERGVTDRFQIAGYNAGGGEARLRWDRTCCPRVSDTTPVKVTVPQQGERTFKNFQETY